MNANVSDVLENTPMHVAALFGRAAIVEALCKPLTSLKVWRCCYAIPYKSLPEISIGLYNHAGRAPIHLAAAQAESEHHRNVITTLVREGKADINQCHLGDGYNASHIAVTNYDHKCLLTCLELAADCNIANFAGRTPRMMAHDMCGNDDAHPLMSLMRCYAFPAYRPL